VLIAFDVRYDRIKDMGGCALFLFQINPVAHLVFAVFFSVIHGLIYILTKRWHEADAEEME